ncbi:PAS domain-containing protein [Methanolapillus ohkumae]|uniref:PAC domain-containing protein n=1 Tax=Methanolapillus ohkumae TaxID=3028298 RepID=A0AA96ZWS4_9EURY|nr:hypothetical protein MsAm2_00170 [Methanosarcinaceae archaeon Am2]
MKLQYKVIILSVLIGFLFLLAESFSRLFSNSSESFLSFLFSPLTTDENLFFNLTVLLLCLVFGILLAQVITRILKAKEIIQEQNVEKNTTLNSIQEILVYFGKNEEIKWANRALYEELNISEKDVIGKKIDIFQNYDIFPSDIITKALDLEEQKSFETRSSDGKYWYITIAPAKDEKNMVSGCVLMAIDITHEKVAEETRRKSFEQIERNIEQFASIIDNIRNPLSSIVLLTEKIEEKDVACQISMECDRIEEVISELDSGWESSEEIKKFLKKHNHP